MKDKRQRVALAWPYGLTADPAFYAYLVNAAAAAASLSQYSYAPHHQPSSPTYNHATATAAAAAAAGSSATHRGYAPSAHLASQFPFPVGLATAAAVAAAVARTPGTSTLSNPEVTSQDLFPTFVRPHQLQSLSSADMAQPSREQRSSTATTLFQPYKNDDADQH